MTEGDQDIEAKQSQREISATTRWGIGIVIALTVQTMTVVWWASSISAQVTVNTREIEKRADTVSSVRLIEQRVNQNGEQLTEIKNELKEIRKEL